MEIPVLRHGQIILIELNIQYQPVGNKCLQKIMHLSFVVAFNFFAFCRFGFFFIFALEYSLY